VVIGLLALILVHPQQKTYSISANNFLPNLFTTAVKYDDSSLVFFNEKSFEVYNFSTGAHRSLGPSNTNLGLNTIDTVQLSGDKRYILFHAEVVAANSALASILAQNKLPASSDYWWVYDTATQNFRPLPQQALLAKFDGTGVETLRSTGAGLEVVSTYGLADLQQTSQINILASSNFFKLGDGFLLQTADNKVVFTKDGVVNNTWFSKTIVAAVSSDGRTAVGVTTVGDDRQLVILDLTNQTSTVVAHNVINQPAWLEGGKVLYATASTKPSSLHSYDIATKQDYTWKLKNGSADLSPVLYLSQKVAIVQSQSSLFLIADHLPATDSLSATYQ
jgi:hypothetical protein